MRPNPGASRSYVRSGSRSDRIPRQTEFLPVLPYSALLPLVVPGLRPCSLDLGAIYLQGHGVRKSLGRDCPKSVPPEHGSVPRRIQASIPCLKIDDLTQIPPIFANPQVSRHQGFYHPELPHG